MFYTCELFQEIIWVFLMVTSDMYYLKQPQESVPLKTLLQTLDKKKGEEW